MKLPFANQAVVERHKLELYLLSPTHPDGRHKQRAFAAAGFTLANVQALQSEILKLARESELCDEVPSPFGKKFVVKGEIATPYGEPMRLCTVWMLRRGEPPPHFVTAYPWKR
jgi:hypothetical protein